MNEILLGVWGNLVLDNRGNGHELPAFAPVVNLQELEPGNKTLGLCGWRGFFLLDRRADPVDMARAYAEEVSKASCGWCVPCRVGTATVAEVLDRIAEGKGREGDLDLLRRVGKVVQAGSMCQFGRNAMGGLLALLDHLEAAFQQAIARGERHPKGRYRAKLIAPCEVACPVHLDVPRYVELIKHGRYTESLLVIYDRNPLPAVCGRVCVRFCELACRRSQVDDPVHIKRLKRFVADMEREAAVKKLHLRQGASQGPVRIAIVGAGPAGLTAAYDLLRRGYQVEIFEALDEPGGMAAVGIPDYRLPREVLLAEVRTIEEMGAKIHYNQVLGRDFTLEDLRERGMRAVFVAIGAHLGQELGIKGEQPRPEGYFIGVEFLRRVNRQEPVKVGQKVVVVGGGNVAIDCARTALRLGAGEVQIVYRRNREAMPADEEEIHEAEREGVQIHFLCNPIRLLVQEGKIVGMECIRMDLGEPDASGRPRPVPIKGSEFLLECDTVITAIGQAVDIRSLGEARGLVVSRRGTLQADSDTLLVSEEGIFAGGDCVLGPATLIEAMAAGLRASASIDLYLREGQATLSAEEKMWRVAEALLSLEDEDIDQPGGQARAEIPQRPVEERVQDFGEVELCPAPADALYEARRCLRCYRLLLVATER